MPYAVFLRAVLAGLLLLCPLTAWAKNVALVVGMGSYQHIQPLKNTLNDAQDIAAKLTELGFEVTLALDKTQADLLDIMSIFAFHAETADLVLVYFSGHGVQIANKNYLIPVDARIASNLDIQRLSISQDQFMAVAGKARKMRILILDSCRNSPFKDLIDTSKDSAVAADGQPASRSTSGIGLAPTDPKRGTLVAYAAIDGQVALDGQGRNGPYAEALIRNLGTPDLEIGLMFAKVRDEVLAKTGNLQEPWTYGSLPSKPFAIVSSNAAPVATDQPAQVIDPRAAWSDSIRPEQEQLLLAMAQTGDTRSLLGLAYIRLNPLDNRYYLTESLAFLERAAAEGAPDAQFELGKLYEQGLGVPADPVRALALYQASADQDFADALNDMGYLHFQGLLGLPVDRALGLDYFRRAADQNHPEALFNYAALIDDGAVPGEGPAEAAAYLYQALRSGSDPVHQQLLTNANQFSAATRKALQSELAARGFYQGGLDGAFGKGTLRAIDAAFGLESGQN